jgi:hypothetical protein
VRRIQSNAAPRAQRRGAAITTVIRVKRVGAYWRGNGTKVCGWVDVVIWVDAKCTAIGTRATGSKTAVVILFANDSRFGERRGNVCCGR